MLYLVPTPIGNLEDITYRAVETLKSVSLILCEDTRHSARLLNHYAITTPTRPFHQHNEHKVLSAIIEQLKSEQEIAIISDAGTPGISDAGYLLVRTCIEHEIPVTCLPGATSIVPAVVASGLPSEKFVYEGFLPHKKGRQTAWEKLAEEERTMVLLESPHRLMKALEEAGQFLGSDRLACVARELTKVHETFHRATIAGLIAHFSANAIKGEAVIVVEGKSHFSKRMKTGS